MILASVLQYADLYAQAAAVARESAPAVALGWFRAALVGVLHPTATVLFLLAVSSIYLGLRAVVAALLQR
jgi:hypothetical protein